MLKNARSELMTLTARQTAALAAAFTKKGTWYGNRNNTGGAYRRMCLRLADDGLVNENAPFPITVKGMVVLRDVWARRWGKHGCMAYQMDLEAVEKALAEVPDLANTARRKLAA